MANRESHPRYDHIAYPLRKYGCFNIVTNKGDNESCDRPGDKIKQLIPGDPAREIFDHQHGF
jgi:hypothetical protein